MKVSLRGNTCAAGAENLLLVSSGRKLAAVDPEECRIIWELKFKKYIFPPPVVREDKIFVCPGNEILAISLGSREEIWRFPTGARVIGKPSISGSVLFAASSDGFLYAIEIKRGRLLWKERLAGPTYSSPLVLKDRVIIPDIPGNLWCFRR